MTALELFLYIMMAASAQAAVFAFVALVRHWRDYKFMQKRLGGLEVDPPPAEPIIEKIVDTGPTPWKGERNFVVAIKEFESANKSICSFYLEPEDGEPLIPYKAGQFLTFNLTVKDPETGGDKAITRCYSLSDSPGGGRYRVSIKRVPPPPNQPDLPPGLSSNHFHDYVEQGDVLKVRAPSGHFYLERGSEPIVLIGGGIGITPMISMLGDALVHDEGREVWLFYGVINSEDHAMKRHLESLDARYPNFKYRVCYSDPLKTDELGKDYHYHGWVSVELMRKTLPFQIYDFYICGPRPMMESIVPGLDDWGVPDQHIHYEAFGPASIERPNRKKAKKPLVDAPGRAASEQDDAGAAPAGPVTVTFSQSGKTVKWDDSTETLLDLAEEHGVDIPSGCRAGGCGTCQTTISSGEVGYTHTPDFDPEPGTCLACVSKAKTDITVEA